MPASPTHDAKVQQLVDQIQARRGAGAPVRFRKSSVSHFVPNPIAERLPGRRIDVQPLDCLIAIDPEARVAVAEPGLTFAELLAETLPHGLMPTCVPELRGITVGGAVSGCSVESMSYKYGGFHDGCLEYEVVTGTGEVRRCSRETDPELFHLVHGSYGTLARLTQVTFRLVPARPYVEMEYVPFARFEDYWAFLKERCERDDYDFVDGIVHGPSHLVACLGRFVSDPPWVSDYTRDRIFYRSTAERSRDYLTLDQYCFRYDTECHWLSRTVPPLEHPWVRRLVGRWFLGSTNLITWSERLRPLYQRMGRPDLVVDVFIPERNFGAFFDWYARELDFWPLWIVPYRMPEPYPWISDGWRERIGEFVIDCAVYGKPNRDPQVDWSAVLERKVFELSGIKTLISRNHYDEETFWTVYNRAGWEQVKTRTDPDNLFGHLYDKMHPTEK